MSVSEGARQTKEVTQMSAMFPELIGLELVVAGLRARLAAVRSDQRGMTTETVIITALLAACALFAVGFIVTLVNNRAQEIKVQ
jgi:hypothetical protein